MYDQKPYKYLRGNEEIDWPKWAHIFLQISKRVSGHIYF